MSSCRSVLWQQKEQLCSRLSKGLTQAKWPPHLTASYPDRGSKIGKLHVKKTEHELCVAMQRYISLHHCQLHRTAKQKSPNCWLSLQFLRQKICWQPKWSQLSVLYSGVVFSVPVKAVFIIKIFFIPLVAAYKYHSSEPTMTGCGHFPCFTRMKWDLWYFLITLL